MTDQLTAAAIRAHRTLIDDATPEARIVRDELASRDIDEDDIKAWGLGCAWADRRHRGIYRGQHLACSWPMLTPTGDDVAALAWRRTGWTDQAAADMPWCHMPAKYAYETGSRPGGSLFGLSEITDDRPPVAIMPEGWPCVLALQKAGLNAASPIGVTISPAQARLAAGACGSWVVMYDNEAQSKLPQAQATARRLEQAGATVRIAFMRTVKDPSEDIAQAVEVIADTMAQPPPRLPPPPQAERRGLSRDAVVEIAAHVDLIELVSRTVELDHGLRGDCPFHGSMGEGSGAWLAVFEGDDGTWRWHCHSGPCGGGTAVEWVARRDGITLREAAAQINHPAPRKGTR